MALEMSGRQAKVVNEDSFAGVCRKTPNQSFFAHHRRASGLRAAGGLRNTLGGLCHEGPLTAVQNCGAGRPKFAALGK